MFLIIELKGPSIFYESDIEEHFAFRVTILVHMTGKYYLKLLTITSEHDFFFRST